MTSKDLGSSAAFDGNTGDVKFHKSGRETGANSDAEIESSNNPRFSETYPSSEMNLGTRFNAQERCYLFTKGRCTYGERCRYAHIMGNSREADADKDHWKPAQRSSERINFCQFFVGGTECPYGNKCRFLHETGGNRGHGGSSMYRESSAIQIITSGGNNDGGRSKKFQTQSSNPPQEHQNSPNFQFPHRNAELLSNIGNPNSLDSSKGYVLGSTPKNRAPIKQGSGIVHQQQENCKGFLFKWTDIKKISEVYGDWIDNVSCKDGN